MNNQKLEIKVALVILRPASNVFEAIIDPHQMSNYFIASGSGKMTEGATVNWKFPEMDLVFPVRVGKVKANEYISFSWKDENEVETNVEITLEPKSENSVMVRIKEGTMEADEKGITWYGRNTEGWANFLACLKAWMEFGINLRKGAFDISQMPGL